MTSKVLGALAAFAFAASFVTPADAAEVQVKCPTNSRMQAAMAEARDPDGSYIRVRIECPTGKIAHYSITVDNWEVGRVFCVRTDTQVKYEFR